MIHFVADGRIACGLHVPQEQRTERPGLVRCGRCWSTYAYLRAVDVAYDEALVRIQQAQEALLLEERIVNAKTRSDVMCGLHLGPTRKVRRLVMCARETL